ncbi:MAG: hypothetical protein AVDCRST_MAG01-01-5109, partial [uncultured Rubrobacteraceae bacterium]
AEAARAARSLHAGAPGVRAPHRRERARRKSSRVVGYAAADGHAAHQVHPGAHRRDRPVAGAGPRRAL